MINPIKFEESIFRRKRTYHVGEPEIPTPKFNCKTCTKQTDGYCYCFLHRIEPDLNKCFFHSNYNPILSVFKPLDNLEQLIVQEQERLIA